jgi:hypothetical protein
MNNFMSESFRKIHPTRNRGICALLEKVAVKFLPVEFGDQGMHQIIG